MTAANLVLEDAFSVKLAGDRWIQLLFGLCTEHGALCTYTCLLDHARNVVDFWGAL